MRFILDDDNRILYEALASALPQPAAGTRAGNPREQPERAVVAVTAARSA